MRKIQLSKLADDFLHIIPAKHAGQLVRRIERLAEDITTVPHVQIIGHSPLRRAKSGEYRIVFDFNDDHLNIHLIDKRNDDQIYKKLDRK